MSTEITPSLRQYLEMAVRILGLPTNRPVTHKDVAMMYHTFADQLHDPITGDALLLVQMLAHDYVDAHAWPRYAAPAPEHDLVDNLVEADAPVIAQPS